MRVETKELTYTYSESSKALSVKALDDVTLTIEEGEFFGIIGQTGSGKTTFVQHLNGLIRLQKDSGEIRIDISDGVVCDRCRQSVKNVNQKGLCERCEKVVSN